MAEFPLDGLDRVDWASLQHAYGSATDVPGMLRELASEGEASHAFDQLFGSLNHQGSVYSATSAAIPFLIQILEDGRRSELVHFLGSVAEAGESSIGVELSKGVGALARLLASEDPAERESAARALGAVTGHKGEAIEALRKAIEEERDQNTRAAMTESLATLDENFAPSRGASAREQFRAARAVARRERADISNKTLDQIAANWRVALEDEASDAGEMIVLGRTFPRAKQLQFYAALLGETTVPLEAVSLARELLVVAFDDRRPAWGGYGSQKALFFQGKHWISLSAGGTTFFVPTEEKTAFWQALHGLPSPEKVRALIDQLKSSGQQPPEDAPRSRYCEFAKVAGKAPAWETPLNPDQRLAVAAISRCDAIWEIATNLWSLFNLPTNREGFADLLDA
jgi:HEAT repeats